MIQQKFGVVDFLRRNLGCFAKSLYLCSGLIMNGLMDSVTLTPETTTYWEQVKGASRQAKLALISLLSASLVAPVAETKSAASSKKPSITREDLAITPFVETIGQGLNALPEDFDYDKAKQEYLMQKYG